MSCIDDFKNKKTPEEKIDFLNYYDEEKDIWCFSVLERNSKC